MIDDDDGYLRGFIGYTPSYRYERGSFARLGAEERERNEAEQQGNNSPPTPTTAPAYSGSGSGNQSEGWLGNLLVWLIEAALTVVLLPVAIVVRWAVKKLEKRNANRNALKGIISRYKKENGNVIFFKPTASLGTKLSYWAEAQRLGVRVEGFEPTALQKMIMGFSPDHRQPCGFLADRNGRIHSFGFDKLDPEARKEIVDKHFRYFKQRSIEVLDLGKFVGAKLQLAFWAEAQKQGIYVINFDPTPEQKEKLGFSRTYQQPYKIIVKKDGGLRLLGFKQLDPKGQEEAVKEYVSRLKQKFGENIPIGDNYSPEGKLALWAEAKKQGITLNFEPTPKQKEELGDPPSYLRYCTIREEEKKNWATAIEQSESNPEQLKTFANDYVLCFKDAGGEVLSITSGSRKSKLAVWKAARDQHVKTSHFEPTREEIREMGYPDSAETNAAPH
jgi:hypothetical protein